MIWDCMSAIGLGFICKIEGSMNRYLYCGSLWPFLEVWHKCI